MKQEVIPTNVALGALFTSAPTTNVYEGPRDCFQYETLEFKGRLEVLDGGGRVARFSRRQRIRFLEDGVGVFMDRVWGDGVLFAGYFAREMTILDLIRTRKGYVVPLALPRRFRKGETFEIETERRIVGGFLIDDAYWDSTMAAPTEVLTVDVVAPRGRRIARPEIIAPPRGDVDAKAKAQVLQFRARRPALHIPYKLTWSWT